MYSENCVICLKIGDAYSAEYVNNLYHAVRKQCDWNFICFTDDPVGIDLGVICYGVKPRECTGWWPTWHKVEIFGRKEIKQYEKKVFFDLDIVIQGDITPILESDDGWSIIRSCWKGVGFRVRNPDHPNFTTCAMTWKDLTWVYDLWESDWKNIVENNLGTDQWYWRSKFKFSFFPDIFYSYREGSKPSHFWENGKEPYCKYQPEYSICLFHQKPEIHELDKDNPLHKIWNATVS